MENKYCNDCMDYVGNGCDNKECKDYKGVTNETYMMFTAFQHWLGTNYNTLPTDSLEMTKRAFRYIEENPKIALKLKGLLIN